MTVPVFKIVPTIQQYDWGRIGNESKVAQFAAASGVPEFTVDDAQPYAEVSHRWFSLIICAHYEQLWMGTHPKSPSKVAPTGQLLSEYLKADPSLIGEQVAKQFKDAQDGNLPFLFKVLSIGKALSIQAHPDKKKAATLHSAKPEIYKGSFATVNSCEFSHTQAMHAKIQTTNLKWRSRLRHFVPFAGSVRYLRS